MKYVKMILGITVGLGLAVSADVWPNHAAAVHMTLYSILILGTMLICMQSYRHRPRYWLGLSVAFLLHAAFLHSARSLFPFDTLLEIILITLGEGIVLLAIVLQIILGDRSWHVHK